MCLLLQYSLVVNTYVPLECRNWKQSENYKQYGTDVVMLYFRALCVPPTLQIRVKRSICSSLITLSLNFFYHQLYFLSYESLCSVYLSLREELDSV